MFFFSEGFTYRNFLLEALAIFLFVVWFWLIITVVSDLIQRHDVSGWVKAFWLVGFIVFPFFLILVYLISQGQGMAERRMRQAQQTREDIRRVIGFSVADEIEKLERLKTAGSISEPEFSQLRTRLVQ